MNWLDWTLLALVTFAAIKGFSRGFIVEICSLLALVLGIWAGIHFSDRVAEAIGLETKSSAVAFLVTFLIVLVGHEPHLSSLLADALGGAGEAVPFKKGGAALLELPDSRFEGGRLLAFVPPRLARTIG